jgi:sugar phosphate isomerase/epimerase
MAKSRREFMTGVAGMAALAASRGLMAQVSKASSCPFRLAVITDEISADFDHACYVASHDFGLKWVEIRSMWGKNATDLSADQIGDAKKILTKYDLRVTDLASPLFKTDLPGAPISKESPHHDQFKAEFTYAEQDALLQKCIDLAKAFGTERIRCFDFWRLEDQKPYRAEINRKLIEAAEICQKQNLILLLENEMACNTGNGEEALLVLNAIPNKNFMLNWDAANAGTFPGNVPFPDAYNKLPKDRIGHVHCKNVTRTNGDKTFAWEPVDIGLIDWVGQFKALKRDGYHYGVSLETHWHGGGTPEASTRISMKGLKSDLVKAGIDCPVTVG